MDDAKSSARFVYQQRSICTAFTDISVSSVIAQTNPGGEHFTTYRMDKIRQICLHFIQ